MKQLFTYLLLCIVSHTLHSQAYHMKRYEDKNYVSIGAGSAGYYGDLQHQLIIPFPSLTIELAHRMSSQVRLRESLSFFLLGAKDANQRNPDLKARNLSFKSKNIELAVTLQFMLLPIHVYARRPKVNPFLVAGLGLVNVDPVASISGENHNLRKLSTEGYEYDRIALSYPIGVGVELALARYHTFIAEFGYRFTNTDYLDDVSTVYKQIPQSSILRARLADRSHEMGLPPKTEGMTRGNPKVKDGYALLSFKLQFLLSHVFK